MSLVVRKKKNKVPVPAMFVSPRDIIPTAKESALVMTRIGRIKKYVHAKLDGKTTVEAKKLAGYSQGIQHKTIMESPVAETILRQYLEKEGQFQDPGIVRKLKQMWDAEEVFVTRTGDVVHKPDWTAQDKALGRVLYLRGYAKDSEGKGDGGSATAAVQINFITTPAEQAADVG